MRIHISNSGYNSGIWSKVVRSPFIRSPSRRRFGGACVDAYVGRDDLLSGHVHHSGGGGHDCGVSWKEILVKRYDFRKCKGGMSFEWRSP